MRFIYTTFFLSIFSFLILGIKPGYAYVEGESGSLILTPATNNKSVGDTVVINLTANSNNQTVSAVASTITFTHDQNTSLSMVSIAGNTQLSNSNWSYPIKTFSSENGKTKIEFMALNTSPTGYILENTTLATLTLKINAETNTKLQFETGTSKILSKENATDIAGSLLGANITTAKTNTGGTQVTPIVTNDPGSSNVVDDSVIAPIPQKDTITPSTTKTSPASQTSEVTEVTEKTNTDTNNPFLNKVSQGSTNTNNTQIENSNLVQKTNDAMPKKNSVPMIGIIILGVVLVAVLILVILKLKKPKMPNSPPPTPPAPPAQPPTSPQNI